MTHKRWHGLKVIILGAARQGTALARYLAKQGAQVTLTDQRSDAELSAARQALADAAVEWITGGHPLEILDGAQLVCPSGGVSLDIPFLVEARRQGIPFSNDSQVFLEAAPCKVVGITGSAGKTTTTSLVGALAQDAAARSGNAFSGKQVWVGGNIGNPLIASLEDMQPGDLVVMELSSFQLEIMTCSPQVAALLNLTPNHLDRHGTMEAYSAAKSSILLHQSQRDLAVLCREDPGAWGLSHLVKGRLVSFGFNPLPAEVNGTYLDGGEICVRWDGQRERILPSREVPLRGRHNLMNVLAACAIAAASGLPVESIQHAIHAFPGVPHRLEFVRRWKDVDWYNDSIATAPERAIAAMHAFEEPLVLLAGGRDKKLPWEAFAEVVSQKVEHLVLFGEAAGLIAAVIDHSKSWPVTIHRCQGLQDAVQVAAQLADPGHVVLLAPGGTSFDEFQDFEERGERYRQWVNDLS